MSVLRPVAFAIPGDIETVTGGYIYERRLLLGLRDQGRDVWHLQLPASFPDPSPQDMATAICQLKDVPQNRILILDGLVFGAIETTGLAQVKAPVLAMIHHPLALETGLTPRRRDKLYRTERDNLRLARHVLVPSPHTRNVLVESYGVSPDRITIARPGINKPSVTRAPTSPPLILSVGILHPRKGHDILIESLSRIDDLNWRAVIVGNAWHKKYAAELARKISDSRLAARISLAGQVSDGELQNLFGQASIFALATRFEGYGMVFDEALSYGLPIVTCATGAVPETVPSDAGILVPPENSTAFADALRHLLESPGKCDQLARASAKHATSLQLWSDTARTAGVVLDGPAFD